MQLGVKQGDVGDRDRVTDEYDGEKKKKKERKYKIPGRESISSTLGRTRTRTPGETCGCGEGVFDRYPDTNESREEEKEARLDDGWIGDASRYLAFLFALLRLDEEGEKGERGT